MRQGMSNLQAQLEAAIKEAAELEKVRKAEEAFAERQTKAAKAIKDECAADLSAALPALHHAIDALQVVTKMDIEVIKSLNKPPELVKMVLEAVCVLMGVKPVQIMHPADLGIKVDDYWTPAKRMLAHMEFLEHLKNYDKDNVSSATMKTLRTKYLDKPYFCPERVCCVSSAAVSLCQWVIGIERYDRIIKVIEPKKTALKAAEAELAVSIEALWKKRASLKQAQDKLDKLQDELQAK